MHPASTVRNAVTIGTARNAEVAKLRSTAGRLNYEALYAKAAEHAKHDASMMQPAGKRREKAERELTAKYFEQYVTPPNQICHQ